eukprot:CAMPEP_0205820864 /NCGR_PEP_ID=MMETSP0206-20130828/3612_1 /ASSEMBLY_ACC=CAM_ASM_000279 /TAXON_ID=36767 /ORGANISM="Euplotes focardii, Strain TN1" /LENGTH=307 /DNA_ID=CAMNT_0053115953 /DNA_START=31 /DNA_END=954 /DNA_ORIENTATION=-
MALALKEADVRNMLAAKVQIGMKNIDTNMRRYVWRRRQDGVYIINLGKTWEKLILAARVIVAIENPADVIAISARKFGQRSVFKFAQHTGSQYIGGRYTPGTFTNQIQRKFVEPRLLIVTDPRTDHQPVLEASYVNVPTIAFCDTDAPLEHVDIAIPCNNKSKNAIALMYWMLAREVLRMRATISRQEPWSVMMDLFLYREPEEVEAEQAAEADAGLEPVAAAESGPTDFVGLDNQKVGEWGAEDAAPAPAAVPATGGNYAAAGAAAQPPAAVAAAPADWNATAPAANWSQEQQQAAPAQAPYQQQQ